MTQDKTKRWISVCILCFINLINYMDRYTVAGKILSLALLFTYHRHHCFAIIGVLSDIGKTWTLSDDEKGLIQTSFIICYFASAPVFGFLGDRYSRKWLMAAGIFAWGTCTLISSFMKVRLRIPDKID